MSSIRDLNGIQVTSCIVRNEFASVCPEYTLEEQDERHNKKPKMEKAGKPPPEYKFYRPFQNIASVGDRYLAASPRALEVLELLNSGNPSVRSRGAAFLAFLLTKCEVPYSRTYISDYVLTRMEKEVVELLSTHEDSRHYFLTVLLECIKSSPVDKVRSFVSSFGFYKTLGKHKAGALKKGYRGYPVTRFYIDSVKTGLIDDVGLSAYVTIDEEDTQLTTVNELLHSNGKKALCLFLLVGLKGLNVLDKPQLLRLILDHVKHDNVVEATCTIRMLIVIIMQVLSTQCSRLSLTLGNAQWSDVPEPIISSTLSTLSHIICQLTEDSTVEKSKIVDLSRLLLSISSEFVGHVENLCDVSTLSTILLKFDVTNVSISDLILKTLAARSQLGPLYMSRLKCNYNGKMEYMVLVRFLSKWFGSIKNESPMECLSYIPPCLSTTFFNYGLLSTDRWVRQGTLRLLHVFLSFINNVRELIPVASDSGAISTAIAEYVSSLIPDFKTVLNVKITPENQNNVDEMGMSLNIKHEKTSMVLNDLGTVVTADSGNILLGIRGSELILTDWLKCLYVYSRLIGVSDGKSLYDPLKLLKDNGIVASVSESNPELDMALLDCIYYLGVGEVCPGVVFTKVQRGSFLYILKKYVELKCKPLQENAGTSSTWNDNVSHCKYYLQQILKRSGYLDERADVWLVSMLSDDDREIFMFLLDHCMDNPLEILLGPVQNCSPKKVHQSFKCLNCSKVGEFDGPLVLRMALNFLLHLCSDTTEDFECSVCSVRQPSIVPTFNKKKVCGLDVAVQYLLRVCMSLEDGPYGIHVKRAVKEIATKHTLKKINKPKGQVAVALTKSDEEAANHKEICITDAYLIDCLEIVDAINSFDQDINSLKELTKIFIDFVSLRLSLPENEDSRLKNKWNDERLTGVIQKIVSLDTSSLYAHVFLSVLKLLDYSPDSAVNSNIFHGVVCNDDLVWMQMCCLSYKLGLATIDHKAAASRFLVLLRNLCSDIRSLKNAEVCTKAITLAKVADFIPPPLITEFVPGLIKEIVSGIEIPISCDGCIDVMTCGYGRVAYLFDVVASLAKSLNDARFSAVLLQTETIVDLTEYVCKMNQERFYVGDAVEAHLFLSFTKMLRSLVSQFRYNKACIKTLNWATICRLLDSVVSCYRCSYLDADLMLKEVIMEILEAAGTSIGDTKSSMLRMPQFSDFACISKMSDPADAKACRCRCGNVCEHDTRSHGESRGWFTMNTGFRMLSEDANWLCLNNKRIAMTLIDFPLSRKANSACLRNTFRNLEIMYPPAITRTPKKSDELFGCIILLNKILKSHNKYVQHLILDDPYYYDIEYLVPFFTGRLCLMFHSQLYVYKKEFDVIFQKLGLHEQGNMETVQNPLVKSFTLSEAHEAAQRLYAQVSAVNFEHDFGQSFSSHAMEQVVKNGVLEICILGLLLKAVRKESIKALGLILKLLNNMMDANMVRSVKPGSIGPYKMKSLGFFGAYQIHSLLFWLQRCQLYASQKAINITMQVIFAAAIVHKVINVEDPMYNSCNKYMMTRFEPKLQEVPLFFECFCVHDASMRPAFLGFIMQLLLSAAGIMEDHSLLFSRRIFQQLMSFALLEGTPLENKVQIASILQRCSSSAETVEEMFHMGTLTWISCMASILQIDEFDDARDLVRSTLLLCAMTKLLKNMALTLSTRYCSVVAKDDRDESTSDSEDEGAPYELPTMVVKEPTDLMYLFRDITSAFEALEKLANAWHRILSQIPSELLTTPRKEGYKIYSLCNEEILYTLANAVKDRDRRGINVSSLLTTSMGMAEVAVRRVSSFLSATLIT